MSRGRARRLRRDKTLDEVRGLGERFRVPSFCCCRRRASSRAGSAATHPHAERVRIGAPPSPRNEGKATTRDCCPSSAERAAVVLHRTWRAWHHLVRQPQYGGHRARIHRGHARALTCGFGCCRAVCRPRSRRPAQRYHEQDPNGYMFWPSCRAVIPCSRTRS